VCELQGDGNITVYVNVCEVLCDGNVFEYSDVCVRNRVREMLLCIVMGA